MVIKKLLLLTMLPLYCYTNEIPRVPHTITPASFAKKGKQELGGYIDKWISIIQLSDIPHDSGLAKIFFDMNNEGIHATIHNTTALEKANAYITHYAQSVYPLMEKQMVMKQQLDSQSETFFSDAALIDAIRICGLFATISHFKDLPIMPQSELGHLLYDCSLQHMREILQLNQNNTALNPHAIRAIVLIKALDLQS